MKIICFGDSNTWGYDPRGYFGGRYDTPWPEILADKLGCVVINHGENGREIPLRAMDFPMDTDLLIVMLGTNDLLQGSSPEAACDRMERFLEALSLDREKILLTAPPPMKLGAWVTSQSLIDDSKSLAKFYQDLAERLGVRFADAGQWNVTMAYDGVHLTEEGHRAFAEGLHKELNNIIISPAKKMNVDTDSFPYQDLPRFLPRTEELCKTLQGMTGAELKKLWKCNNQIAALNIERLRNMDLHNRLTPAVLAYEGIQYRYMAPGVFTDQAFSYIQEHLRILSGFYGVLKPFDGVTPYRLEMQAKLRVGEAKDLYAYWGDSLANTLFEETDCIINLASKEYSVCISKYLPENVRFITCVFGEEKDGKVIEKGTMCKMARGEMVRYMAENQIRDVEQIKFFDRLNYRFDPARSDDKIFVFILNATGG